MSIPRPALVTLRAARRLPRVALLALVAAYLLPGLFGRDPWRHADLSTFGQMLAIAEGRSGWLAPMLGGVPGDAALLPHWLGAGAILLLSPLVDAPLAARLAFAALLALTLFLTWATTYHLALTDAAQPLPLAFGGEADPVDYARAIADASVLALMATLGLLQLGHETTPELAQLACVSLFAYALAAAPFRRWKPRLAVLAALPLLAGSGGPTMALVMGLAGAEVCRRSGYPAVRAFMRWVVGATALAVALSVALDAWEWRLAAPEWRSLFSIPRQWLWFMWPTWPLALWTLWRWRHYVAHRHLAVPLAVIVTALAANLAMGGSDRALMLGLPGLAVLAAFALPTLQRSASAAIDWFSMFFFSAAAITIWVLYSAMQTGTPSKPAANIAKLAPGFEPRFSTLALAAAVLGTLAWLWLVRWRTGRHQEALWKSLVLPAGGVALCWLLTMTLLLPPLDYARSNRALVQRIAPHVQADECIAAPRAATSLVAALEVFGRWQVDARSDAAEGSCGLLLRVGEGTQAPRIAGWTLAATLTRPTDRKERTWIYRRSLAAGTSAG
ncbi:MAG TPA: hypothetical protein PKJ45_11335 [Rubrivivax sp.]|nr:hypothetical protein [Burkholderiales bacterium]HNU11936.1 hypothetical protein [Rubrivivax sp.]